MAPADVEIAVARTGLIAPFVVGPRTRIVEVATQNTIDTSRLRFVRAPCGHASAEKAVEFVREGRTAALIRPELRLGEVGPLRRFCARRLTSAVPHCH